MERESIITLYKMKCVSITIVNMVMEMKLGVPALSSEREYDLHQVMVI